MHAAVVVRHHPCACVAVDPELRTRMPLPAAHGAEDEIGSDGASVGYAPSCLVPRTRALFVEAVLKLDTLV
jgi:hypothetical protein